MITFDQPFVIALSGGVGGAKLSLGLSKILSPEQLLIVANTADDFEFHGLPISPDIDTLMYTLAGVNNTRQGWGLAGETWQVMSELKERGAESWFQLGDKDLATHLQRLQLLKSGLSLTEVTAQLSRQLGVAHTILPMTDDSVQTFVNVTDEGEGNEQRLAFQEYFVREQCQPRVAGFEFVGIESATANPEFVSALSHPNLQVVIICPSNPFVSVDPILSLPGIRAALKRSSAPVVAVSPIVAGQALKGPTAKMMHELKLDISVLGVVEFYGDLLEGVMIDHSDSQHAAAIEALGIQTHVGNIIMKSLEDRIELAKCVLSFAETLRDTQG